MLHDLARRDFLKYSLLTAGATGFGPSLVGRPSAHAAVTAAAAAAGGPKRFVFINTCNGLPTSHVVPSGFEEEHQKARRGDEVVDVELDAHPLSRFMEPLADLTADMTVVSGLYGHHLWPGHGCKFGYLAGSRSAAVPRLQTVDHALSQTMPKTPMQILGFAQSQLNLMKATPVTTATSAAGDSKALPEFADPRLAYQSLFGCAAGGQSAEGFAAETEWYEQTIAYAEHRQRQFAGAERQRFELYVDGLRRARQQRINLLAMKDRLAANLPDLGERLENPEHDRDWHEVQFDIGIAALKAGITNVVTFDGGGGCPDWSPMSGFDVDMGRVQNSHYLGHMDMKESPEWVTMRHWSLGQVKRIVDTLKATPEPDGRGSMFDHTLIVYSSDSGSWQHELGFEWSFLLLGNLGGRLRNGRFLQYPVWGGKPGGDIPARGRPEKGRSINAMWATLLHAAGNPVDHFNLVAGQADLDRKGPLEELLV